MSMVSGPSATKAPSTTIIRARPGNLTSGNFTSSDVAMNVVSTAHQ
jgi:hypothetical protein